MNKSPFWLTIVSVLVLSLTFSPAAMAFGTFTAIGTTGAFSENLGASIAIGMAIDTALDSSSGSTTSSKPPPKNHIDLIEKLSTGQERLSVAEAYNLLDHIFDNKLQLSEKWKNITRFDVEILMRSLIYDNVLGARVETIEGPIKDIVELIREKTSLPILQATFESALKISKFEIDDTGRTYIRRIFKGIALDIAMEELGYKMDKFREHMSRHVGRQLLQLRFETKGLKAPDGGVTQVDSTTKSAAQMWLAMDIIETVIHHYGEKAKPTLERIYDEFRTDRVYAKYTATKVDRHEARLADYSPSIVTGVIVGIVGIFVGLILPDLWPASKVVFQKLALVGERSYDTSFLQFMGRGVAVGLASGLLTFGIFRWVRSILINKDIRMAKESPLAEKPMREALERAHRERWDMVRCRVRSGR